MRREKGGQLMQAVFIIPERQWVHWPRKLNKRRGKQAKTGTLGINNKWGWRWGKLISSGDYWRGRRRTKENSYQRQERLSRTDRSQRNRSQWVRTEESLEVIGDPSGRAFSQVNGARLEKFWGVNEGVKGSGIFHQDRDGRDHGADGRGMWGFSEAWREIR